MNFRFSGRAFLNRTKMLVATGLIVLMGWIANPAISQAAPLDDDQVESLENVSEKMDNKAKADLDNVAGLGTSAQLEGKVERTTGVIQENFGDARDDLEQQVAGTANRLKGNVKEATGGTAKALDNAADDLEDAGEGLVEKVKNFFD